MSCTLTIEDIHVQKTPKPATLPSKKMSYDPAVPTALKSTQQWFASIITQKLHGLQYLPKMTPRGHLLQSEAKKIIKPNEHLTSGQRIELYSQQYWWRLLKHLHEIFPTVTSMIGYKKFNETIGFPYLTRYPATHWSLNTLGQHLPKWMAEAYKGKWPSRLLHAAVVDLAYNDAFVMKQKEALTLETLPTPGRAESLLGISLYLQEHLFLFSFPYDFFAFRSEIVDQKIEHWEKNPLPPLMREKLHTFALWRNIHNDTVWDYIHPIEYKLLTSFRKGTPIDDACGKLTPKQIKEAGSMLASWFECWVRRGWLTTTP